MLLILGLYLYKWRMQIYGWYKFSIFLSSKVMPTKMEWDSVFLATIFKHNAGNCSCSCLCMCTSLFPYCLCGKMCSLAVLFLFFPDDQTQLFSRSQPSFFSFFTHLLLLFFPFSSFEYGSNCLHPYPSRCSNRIGCLYSSPFLLFPCLWVHTSWGIVWT